MRYERICIPTSLQKGWIRSRHEGMMHIGGKRLWKHLELRYEFAEPKEAERYTMEVTRQCVTCQAVNKARNNDTGWEYTFVAPSALFSVAMDMFQLPAVAWKGERYDAVALCVDRHSGWIMAVPGVYKGFTGRKLAYAMYEQWRMFGVPGIVTSDQGSHFVNQWWETLCAKLGVRQAYSHAYLPRANGRAEAAGQAIIQRLKALNQDGELNWVEALPRVLDRYHDTP